MTLAIAEAEKSINDAVAFSRRRIRATDKCQSLRHFKLHANTTGRAAFARQKNAIARFFKWSQVMPTPFIIWA